MAELLHLTGAAVVYRDHAGKSRYVYAPAGVEADAMGPGERDRLVDAGLLRSSNARAKRPAKTAVNVDAIGADGTGDGASGDGDGDKPPAGQGKS